MAVTASWAWGLPRGQYHKGLPLKGTGQRGGGVGLCVGTPVIPVSGFEYSQRSSLHSPSRQPVPVLCHPQSREVFPHVQMELLLLQFVPVTPCPVSRHH